LQKCDFGLPSHLLPPRQLTTITYQELSDRTCRPCANKLYTCNKVKVDFIEANNKLEKCLGFTKSPRIRFLSTIPAVYHHHHHHTLDGVTEEEMVSRNEGDLVPEVEEQLVSEVEGQSEVPSEDLCRVTPNSKKNFLEGKKMTLNTRDDLSVNLGRI
jgi:hypothetical protein